MLKKIMITGCFWVMSLFVMAQDNLHIDNNGQMAVFGSIGVFGDVNNEGEIYTQDSQSVLVFYGQYWENAPNALNTGGGGVNFVQPNSLYGSLSLQHLDGGGATASFGRLRLNNSSGLLLINRPTQVRDLLYFEQGKITLDGHNLIIEENGELQNYNEDRFVVTDGQPGDINGTLQRQGAGRPLDFPIGFSALDYTPVRIENNGDPDLFTVRAFPDVYQDGTTGTLANDASVGISWVIREALPGGSDVTLTLQHPVSLEGPNFLSDRNYVSRYIGDSPNSLGGEFSLPDFPAWDYTGSASCLANIDGNITTGAVNPDAKLSIRAGLTNFSDYTIYTVRACPNYSNEDFLFPNAFSPNGDGVNDTWVIDNLSIFQQTKLTIVNRWGDVVYKTESYQNDWDGTFNGGKLPDGTYYYIFDFGGTAGIQKGPITIVRN